MKNDTKKPNNRNRFHIVIVIILLLAGFSFALRSCGTGEGLHNYSDRADELRGRITESTESNKRLQDELGSAERTVDKIETSIERSAEAVTGAETATASIENNLGTAADAISSCQQIIRNIKQRNEK